MDVPLKLLELLVEVAIWVKAQFAETRLGVFGLRDGAGLRPLQVAELGFVRRYLELQTL